MFSVPITSSCAKGYARLLCIAPKSEFRRSNAISQISPKLYILGIYHQIKSNLTSMHVNGMIKGLTFSLVVYYVILM